jgi:hypothetical protein
MTESSVRHIIEQAVCEAGIAHAIDLKATPYSGNESTAF